MGSEEEAKKQEEWRASWLALLEGKIKRGPAHFQAGVSNDKQDPGGDKNKQNL